MHCMATPTGDRIDSEAPHQPGVSYSFPKRKFGKKQEVLRVFQRCWFAKWNWLHYSEVEDSVLCFTCWKAEQEGKLRSTSKDQAFISRGFTNWKDGPECFRRHEESKCHKEAYDMIVSIPNTVPNVGKMLSTIHSKKQHENRKALMVILENTQFLGRQGIAFRGHEECEGNFIQLFKLRSKDDPSLEPCVDRKGSHYLSPSSQNELLQLMSLAIQRDIMSNIHDSNYFTIMADECTDSANKEQVVICLRWVDHKLEVHEDFIGLYNVPDISANTIFSVITDCLLRMNLQWNRCRGQCFDGAANMTGIRNGVATKILQLESRALFTHCYGHSLNLAVCDTIKNSKVARDALDTSFEITKLIKFSPKREAMFDQLKKDLTPDCPGIRVLCPTRWTVRAQSLISILQNYTVLQELWDIVLDQNLDSEVRARVIGVKAQMESFDYYFGVCIGELVLSHADNLSKTLQSKTISAAEGQHIAEMTITVLNKMRSTEAYDLFWSSILKKKSNIDVAEPVLPRHRKRPKRYEAGSEEYSPPTVKDHFQRQYFEILDCAINCIKSRFDQPGYNKYSKVESLLLKAMKGEEFEEEYDFVCAFYNDDVSSTPLKIQLQTLATQISEKNPSLIDLLEYMKHLNPSQFSMFSEVFTLLKIVLVNPSTNSASERSFSAMRRIKTYLRSSMSQARLNSTMILHVHKERTDQLCLKKIATTFVNNERRESVFGKFE